MKDGSAPAAFRVFIPRGATDSSTCPSTQLSRLSNNKWFKIPFSSGTLIPTRHCLACITVKVKAKLSLCLTKHHAMKTYWVVEVKCHAFFTSALEGSKWSASPPPPDSGTRWIGDWLGPRAGLDAVEKRKILSPFWESNSQTPIVLPVPSLYADWAVLVLM
jgi:hypothetical protein